MKKRDLVEYHTPKPVLSAVSSDGATDRECRTCGAQPGQSCCNRSGKRCAPHTARSKPPSGKRRRRAAEQYEPADLFAELDGPGPEEGGGE